ncbi:MAG: endo alpha-1,4 polygalactosaminidase [Anaerolineales bacterium]|nr:endo alpha-1,4 polygalactosaminidase [Anaerolineales bacterium]
MSRTWKVALLIVFCGAALLVVVALAIASRYFYLPLVTQRSMATPDQTPEVTPGASWWKPSPGVSWQWQLSGVVDTTIHVEMYDIDLFEAPQATIDQLHADGRVVICYFSAGSWEDWRPDAANFPESVLGNDLEGWEGERWLDIRRIDLLGPIMEARLDMAVQKNCDGVEPDNVDGFENNSGFSLSGADQLAYNRWLAEQAHARSLSIGLKNDLAQIADLFTAFDWALNEECFTYNECDQLLPFVHAGKAVFGVEYELGPEQFCPTANAMGFDFLRKNWDLDAWRIDCHDY